MMLDHSPKEKVDSASGGGAVVPPILLKSVSLGSSTCDSTYGIIQSLDSPDSLQSLTHYFENMEDSHHPSNRTISSPIDKALVICNDTSDDKTNGWTSFPQNDEVHVIRDDVETRMTTSPSSKPPTLHHSNNKSDHKVEGNGNDITWTACPFSNNEVEHAVKDDKKIDSEMMTLWGYDDDDIKNTSLHKDNESKRNDAAYNDGEHSPSVSQNKDPNSIGNDTEWNLNPFPNDQKHHDMKDEKENDTDDVMKKWRREATSPLTEALYNQEEDKDRLIHSTPSNPSNRFIASLSISKPLQWITPKIQALVTPTNNGERLPAYFDYQCMSDRRHEIKKTNLPSYPASEKCYRSHESRSLHDTTSLVHKIENDAISMNGTSCQFRTLDHNDSLLKTRFPRVPDADADADADILTYSTPDRVAATSAIGRQPATVSPPDYPPPPTIDVSLPRRQTQDEKESSDPMILPCCQKLFDQETENPTRSNTEDVLGRSRSQDGEETDLLRASSTITSSTKESGSTENSSSRSAPTSFVKKDLPSKSVLPSTVYRNRPSKNEKIAQMNVTRPSLAKSTSFTNRTTKPRPKLVKNKASVSFTNRISNAISNIRRHPKETSDRASISRRHRRDKHAERFRHVRGKAMKPSSPKHTKEYQDLVHRIQQTHEQYLKGTPTQKSSLKSSSKKVKVTVSHKSSSARKENRDKKTVAIHCNRKHGHHYDADDSSVASGADSITSYKSMMHRSIHQSYALGQYSMDDDDDCSSIVSKISTNSLSSHRVAMDSNQPQPYHGYSHDDDSSSYLSVSSSNSSYHIYAQSETGYLSDSVSIISESDPLGKKSRRVPKSMGKEGDGDVWVEKTYRNKRTGTKRTYFVSVQTGKRSRDEPPTGASKVIYKDTKYVTNLNIVPIPVVSFEK